MTATYGSIGSTIFFLISFGFLFSGTFLWRKTGTKEQGMTWLPLTGVLIAFFHALAAALITIIPFLPVNLWSLGTVNLAAGLFFWYRIKKTGERQQYQWSVYDLIFVSLILIVVLSIAKIRYGLPELDWSYRTVDPAARYREAMEFINNGAVSRMFFAQSVNGTTMEIFDPFLRYDYYYRLYVLSDILQLILSGWMFYGASLLWTRKNGKLSHFTSIAAIVSVFFYLLGYPLNSTLYGFTYLGMSLYLVAATVVIADRFAEGGFSAKWFPILMLMLLMHAMFQCYLLFMPVTFLSVGFLILAKQKKAGKLLSKGTLIEVLSVFVIPIILGFYFTYRDVFINDNVAVSDAIGAEGSIYRDLYSNFLYFLPPAVFGLVLLIRKKKNSLLSWFMPLFLVFMIGMFAIAYGTGRISTYYYFKNYYMLWLVVFLLIVYALSEADRWGRGVVIAFLCSWSFSAFMFVSEVEIHMQAKSGLFVPDRKSERYNSLIAFNLETLFRPHYPAEKMELMHYVYENLLSTGETLSQVPVCSTEEETYLYESVTGQRLKDYEFWRSEENDIQYFINVKDLCDYVCVYTDCPLYEVHKEVFWDDLPVIWSNSAGFIAKVE